MRPGFGLVDDARALVVRDVVRPGAPADNPSAE